jgi:predicted metal-dependent peptidase
VSLAATDLDRIAAAKLWLVSRTGLGVDAPRDLPYLAHALYALIPVMSSSVPRIACDEYWRLYVNPSWLADASTRDVAAELVHVTWHLLHDHANRARDIGVSTSTAREWKRACDLAIAHMLRPDGLMPDEFVSPADMRLPDGLSAEEYYAAVSGLPASSSSDGPPEAGCGSGCDGLNRSWELPPGLDIGEVEYGDAAQIRRLVAIAYREHITDRGDTPGDAWRWTKDILEPTIPWAPLLAAAVRRAVAWTNGNTHYTYSRRSRRQSALPDFVLPGTRRPVPNVAVVVDTSGSIDDTLLSRALGEVDGALRGLGVSDASVTVLACDAAVQTVAKIRNVRESNLAGGGGTDMRKGIAAAADLRPKPDLIVVFTDGYTPWPEEPPAGSAVIAGILGRKEHALPPSPAWAKRIECLL